MSCAAQMWYQKRAKTTQWEPTLRLYYCSPTSRSFLNLKKKKKKKCYLWCHICLPVTDVLQWQTAGPGCCKHLQSHTHMASHLLSRPSSYSPAFSSSVNTQGKPGQPADRRWLSSIFVYVPKSCLITRLSVRSHVCGGAPVESPLQTAGVWSPLLNESSGVCAFRGFGRHKENCLYICGLALFFLIQLRLDGRLACG